LAALEHTDGFRFCAQVGCAIAYFHSQSGERILCEQVRVPIGQKQTAPLRLLCYCFDHTAQQIQTQIAETGNSTIPEEIGAKCKQGLDRCRETNPQGSCCLADVRGFVRTISEENSRESCLDERRERQY